MYQADPPRPPSETLPTMYDLPSEDAGEFGLPDEFHEFQPQLLRETCQPPTVSAAEMFIGTDINLYYDGRNPQWYKRPDWFLVLGVARARTQETLRLSYVIWQEAIAPFLVVELLSPGTEAEDLGQTLREVSQPPTKWQVYEQSLRIPYYALFDRYDNRFRLFQLVGSRYQEVALADGRFWFEELALGLGVWQGAYEGTVGQWLRWYDEQGDWVPTAAERAEQAQQRLKQEQAKADQAQQRAERLANRLRELGINPDEV